MKKIDQVSDELINSFVDEQLSPSEKSELLEAINADEDLSAKVCDAQRLKAMVSHAYQHPPQARKADFHGNGLLKYRDALVAGLALVVCATGGWYAHSWWEPVDLQDSSQAMRYLQPAQLADNWTGQQKIVLHMGSSDPEKFKASLDRAEYFLNTARKSGYPLKVEFVVSSGGLNLLRTGITPYADRIKSMKQSYDNLAFVACSQSIDRLREKGGKVDLLPETTLAPDSALEVVVSRLRDGWTYISI